MNTREERERHYHWIKYLFGAEEAKKRTNLPDPAYWPIRKKEAKS